MCGKSRKNKRYELCNKQIRENLRTNDEKLIDTIYSICWEMMLREFDRIKDIDSKALGMFEINGICFSILFAFGRYFFKEQSSWSSLYQNYLFIIIISIYLLTNISFLLSSIFLFGAFKARIDFRWVKDADLFRKKQIDEGVKTYKRYIIAHFWEIYRNNDIINEKKARKLKYGQVFFFIAIIFIFILIFTLVISPLK